MKNKPKIQYPSAPLLGGTLFPLSLLSRRFLQECSAASYMPPCRKEAFPEKSRNTISGHLDGKNVCFKRVAGHGQNI